MSHDIHENNTKNKCNMLIHDSKINKHMLYEPSKVDYVNINKYSSGINKYRNSSEEIVSAEKNKNFNNKGKELIKIIPDKTQKKLKYKKKKIIRSLSSINGNENTCSKQKYSNFRKKNEYSNKIEKLELKTNFTTDSFDKYMQNATTNLLIKKYGHENFYRLLQNEENSLISIKFLQKHAFLPSLRSRMVDWMIEVFSVFRSDPGIFEFAVHLMDHYLDSTQKIISNSDIHLLGLTCIYIASKCEDIIPFPMNIIYNDIGHKCFDIEKIKKKKSKF